MKCHYYDIKLESNEPFAEILTNDDLAEVSTSIFTWLGMFVLIVKQFDQDIIDKALDKMNSSSIDTLCHNLYHLMQHLKIVCVLFKIAFFAIFRIFFMWIHFAFYIMFNLHTGWTFNLAPCVFCMI